MGSDQKGKSTISRTGEYAALSESECSPTRIAFATSSLQNAGLADLSLPLLARIGAIRIEVESVEPISPPSD